MARLARGAYLDPQTIQIVHVTSRCVRRAFLCGSDPYSGKCYEHRRQWIRGRLEFLASIFAVDCLTFAVMSNHLHLIVRSRPDVVRSWTDEQVATRWLQLCPERDDTGKPLSPRDNDINSIVNDARRVAELRIRLSDISWWMRMTAQKIAQEANKEDGCTGRFWEGRYKAQLLLDEAAILACAMYVDLNPIRAAMAETPETSEFTGAKNRIDDLKESGFSLPVEVEADTTKTARKAKTKNRKPNPSRKVTHRWERSRGRKQSGWMSPIEISELADPTGADPGKCGRRASLKGFLSITLCKYLELLDWTGRLIRGDKHGAIPSGLAPILVRLGIQADQWKSLVGRFGKLFKRAAGNSVSIAEEASRRGQSWMQSPGSSCFET